MAYIPLMRTDCTTLNGFPFNAILFSLALICRGKWGNVTFVGFSPKVSWVVMIKSDFKISKIKGIYSGNKSTIR